MIDGDAFDPRTTGPVEVARRVSEWLSINLWRLLGVALATTIVLGVGVERGWFVLPSVPTSIWVVLSGAFAGVVLGAYPIYRVLLSIWDDSSVRLVELDPRSGDLSVWSISEERFQDLRVIDHRGNAQDASTFLNDIRLGDGSLGYEVDAYDVESNVAVSSWMGGARNREVRRHEKAIDYIKKELSIEADKTLDQLINSNDVLRQQGKAVGMYLIKTIEGVQTPDSGDTRLHEEMFNTLDDTDLTDSLLSDGRDGSAEDAIRAFVEEEAPAEPQSESDDGDDGEDGRVVIPTEDAETVVSRLSRNGHGKEGDS